MTQDKGIEEKIKSILDKVRQKQTGYRANSFARGIKDLKEIERLMERDRDD